MHIILDMYGCKAYELSLPIEDCAVEWEKE